MPTASTGSWLSWILAARRLPTWSIAFSSGIRLARPSRSAHFGRASWLHAIKRRWRKLDADWQLVVPTDLCIDPRARPQPALLGQLLAGGDTEARAIGVGPLAMQ